MTEKETLCDARVGPVPKLDGEMFWCCLSAGHDGDHEDVDGTWFVDAVARRSAVFPPNKT